MSSVDHSVTPLYAQALLQSAQRDLMRQAAVAWLIYEYKPVNHSIDLM